MKLESLKSEKFAAFKGDEIENPLLIKGGALIPTTFITGGSSYADTNHTGNHHEATMANAVVWSKSDDITMPMHVANGNNGGNMAMNMVENVNLDAVSY